MKILIDSSVLLDVVTQDSVWFEWSASTLASVAEYSELCINPLIYAETSVRFTSSEKFDEVFPESDFKRLPLPYEAAFLAGRAFVKYRRNGGLRNSPMPDFYIGAHAAVANFRVLTRDPRRLRMYFPAVELIVP